MGVDCVWVARNFAGLTVDNLRARVERGDWPGGTGTLVVDDDHFFEVTEPDAAYHWFEFLGPSAPENATPPNVTGEYLVIHDGCRRWGDGGADFRDLLRAAIVALTGDADVYLCGDDVWSGMDSIDDLLRDGWPADKRVTT